MQGQGKLWFRRRRFGWGWSPASKEGWGVLLAYLLVILTLKATLTHGGFALTVGVVLATLALLAIGFAKGESPRWQWGGD